MIYYNQGCFEGLERGGGQSALRPTLPTYWWFDQLIQYTKKSLTTIICWLVDFNLINLVSWSILYIKKLFYNEYLSFI